jgi:tetratricopeptide (TPR) repeat protein
LTRKVKAVLTAASLALILALLVWGCGKPKETPLQRAERLLLKDDAASIQEAIVALREAQQADPQEVRVHALLGTAYMREARTEQNRDKSEERYNLAIAELEKTMELRGQTGASADAYRQLVDVCHERALLPRRFNVERDVKLGVGPWEVKAMEKGIKALEEGHAHFPEDPAFSAEKAKALQKELTVLKGLYMENAQRAWSSRPSGFASPDTYKREH